jgi:hypothetical protein
VSLPWCAAFAFVLLLGGSALADDEEDRGIRFDIEGDIELAHEAQGDDEATEVTFDEVGLALAGPWWAAELGIKYRSEGDRGLAVEDAALRVGGVERWPWFAEVGRTVLPFAETDSPFGEDPLVTVIGETYDEAIVAGFAGEIMEVALGAFRGELGSEGEIGLVGSAKLTPVPGLRVGVSWCNDLGEAVELRELRQDFFDERGSGETLVSDEVNAIAGAVEAERGAMRAELHYLSALERFDPGQLAAEALTPAAWNFEAGAQPAEGWEVAARVELSRDFPDNPKTQYGAAASYQLHEHASITAEYLRGEFRGDAPDRDLLGMKLALVY